MSCMALDFKENFVKLMTNYLRVIIIRKKAIYLEF
jgi:hypothetical protein